MTSEVPSAYCMRGHRVPALSPDLISDVAQRVCQILKFKRSSFRSERVEQSVARLEEYGIHVDVVEDRDWIDATRATVDPQKAMIYVPDRLYADLCKGRVESVRIFLHELGHIVLAHKPLLHFSERAPTQIEDSEWQADHFADAIISYLGLTHEYAQLEFRF